MFFRADPVRRGGATGATRVETIREAAGGEVTVVRVAARSLGARNAGELGRDLDALAGPGARVVIDLRDVAAIDGAGCGAILTGHRRLTGEGGRLHVCGLSRSLRLPLQLVRMHRRLEVYNTELEAIEACGR